ncbi:hypothetical protein ACMC5R_02505 [Deferribacteres bacterium DY0037]
MAHMNRRQFVKLSLTALGGVMLTGCGGFDGGGSGPDIPSGYKFYQLKNVGSTVATSGSDFTIDKFYGVSHISDNGIITFDAVDSSNTRGIFQLGLDFSGTSPVIDWERSAVIEGDVLEDNRLVSSIRSFDADENGNLSAVLEADVKQSEDHYGAGLYIDNGQNGFEPLMLCGQAFSDGEKVSSGIFGDVSYNGGSLLVSAHHCPNTGGLTGHMDSILHIPNSSLSDAEVILSAGSIVPGANSLATSFGLIDHNTSGDYSASVFMQSQENKTSRNGLSVRQSVANISGNLKYPKDVQTKALSLDSGDDNDTLTGGEIAYGTRVGPSGEVYSLVSDDDSMTLLKDGKTFRSTGDNVLSGTALSLANGTVSPDGIFYYSAVLDHGDDEPDMSIFAYNGFSHSAILSTGDIINSSGASVYRMLFGTSTRHADSGNRLVFLCAFSDGTTSLVLGIPS